MSTAFVAKVRRFALQFRYVLISLVLLNISPLCDLAQDGYSHTPTPQQHEPTPQQKSKASALIRIVGQSTERFRNVYAAQAEGNVLQFGCVSGSDSGAMGLHYGNGTLVNRGEIVPTHPQIGADFLVIAEARDKKRQSPSELMGQLFHCFEFPNRFGFPGSYTLHVWAWKDNPNGAFMNWHPNVSCELFGGQTS